ncbi:ankyrin repeat domain-containing protein [Paraburkholderia strydomiana]|uniref:ankyrin repeat domain-containing protein n=1 Tax=Paraburkholderia strydomiana TaxID=1245417 RepID=UPI00286B7CA6|nr:ankyrin repeat domain-containing protein [Paraburkholderia strydomiana]
MKYRKLAIAGAVAVAVCVTSPFWWPTQAEETHMSTFKRYPPEDFFSGVELELARAIRDGDLARTRELIPKVDLSLVGRKEMTMLAFAVQETVPVKTDAGNVRYQIVSELVRHGAKPEQPFGQTRGNVACIAARADSPALLKALLAGGMSPDLRYDGDTPLLFAVAEDNLLAQLRVLVENNANVNLKDSLGNTAIFGATQIRQWDSVDYLLSHKADPTVVNDGGVTYAKVLKIELDSTPKGSPQLERIEAIRKKLISAGGKWPTA